MPTSEMSLPVATGARGHRTIEHTADAGIEAWGPTLADAYEESAAGLFELMLDPATIDERESRRIRVTGDDDGDLLVRWLTELLFFVDAEALVFRRLVVERMSPHELVATGYGERLDPARHLLRTAVKAATYHELRVDAGPPARVRVLLDI